MYVAWFPLDIVIPNRLNSSRVNQEQLPKREHITRWIFNRTLAYDDGDKL